MCKFNQYNIGDHSQGNQAKEIKIGFSAEEVKGLLAGMGESQEKFYEIIEKIKSAKSEEEKKGLFSKATDLVIKHGGGVIESLVAGLIAGMLKE